LTIVLLIETLYKILKVINLHQQENELIRLAVENNRQAQQKIYSQFSPKMLSVCRQYIKDIHQAEDIMITAFMKVFTNLKNFQFKGSFEGWIRRIMVNECISFIRVHKKLKYIEDDFVIGRDEESFDAIESQFSVADIQFLIDSLPDGYKIVFNLYAIEGYKHQEIAVMLGISEGTSKSQLSHARKVLKGQINKLKKYSNGTE
jgi:RNA polymerase sigma-70 factor (ECF subfamily)